MLKKKHQIIKDTAHYGAARYLTLVVSFVVSILQKKMLGPALTGVWNVLALVKMYTQFGDLGIGRAIELKLPALYSRQEKEEFERIKDIGFSSTMLLMIFVNLIILAATFFVHSLENRILIIGVRLIVMISILESMANYVTSASFTCKKRFSLFGSQIIRAELIFSLVSIIGIFFFKLYGLLIALAFMVVYEYYFVIAKTRDKYTLRLNLKETVSLITIGLPLIVYALIMRTYENIDRIVIVRYLTLEKLGYYSIATMIFTSVNDFPLVVGKIFYPRIVSLFSEEKESKVLISYLLKSQAILMFVMMLIISSLFFFFPLLINYFLPKFVYGIRSMQILVFCAFFSSLLCLPLQYCIVMHKRWRLVFILGAISLFYFLSFGFVFGKHIPYVKDIDLVAIVRVIVNFIFFSIISFIVFFHLRLARLFVSYFLKVCLNFIYFALGLWFINSLFPCELHTFISDLKIVCYKLCLLLLLFIPLAIMVHKETGIFSILRKMFLERRVVVGEGD
jgi:O-antigen/teichoic acid export membrane protein